MNSFNQQMVSKRMVFRSLRFSELSLGSMDLVMESRRLLYEHGAGFIEYIQATDQLTGYLYCNTSPRKGLIKKSVAKRHPPLSMRL
jgi:hypothetical protein